MIVRESVIFDRPYTDPPSTLIDVYRLGCLRDAPLNGSRTAIRTDTDVSLLLLGPPKYAQAPHENETICAAGALVV
jgi:hypothetical protein